MDMEIQFLHDNFTEKDPKLLMGHIQRMAFGEAPFFATALSLVYDKLVEKAFARPVPSGSGIVKFVRVEYVKVGSVAGPSGAPLTSTSSGAPSVSPLIPQTPAPDPRPGPVASSTDTQLARLQCPRCREPARLEDLYDGLRCPECPPKSDKKGRPYMHCSLCLTGRTLRQDGCLKIMCGARFR